MPRIRKRPEYCDPNTQISTGNGEFATYNSVYRRFGHGPSRGRGILRQNNPLGEIQSATSGRALEKDHVLSSWNVPPTELDENLLYCARIKYESEACRQENRGYNPDRYLDCIDDDSKERLLELHKDDYYGNQQDCYSSWFDANQQDCYSSWFDGNPDPQDYPSSWFDGNPDPQDYSASWFDASVDYESRWSNFDSSKYQTPQGIDNMLDRLKEEELELRRRKLGLWNQRMMRKTYDVLDPFHPYGEAFYQNETRRMYKEPIIKKKSKRKSKKKSKRNRKLEDTDYSEESNIRSYCDVCCVKVDEPLSEHNLSDFHMIKVEICEQGCPYCFVTKFNNFNHFGHHILEVSHSDIMKLAKKKSESLQKELVLEINPKFDSKLGEDYVEPITGYFCRLCRQFLHEEEDTILKHCQLTVHQALHHNHIENCCSIERAIADEMIRKSATSQKQGCSTKDEPNAPVIIDSFAERNIQILRSDEVIDQLESDISSEDIHFTLEGHNCPIIKSNEHPESSHPEANIEANMELIDQGLEPNTETQQGLEPNMALIQQGLEPNMTLIQHGLEPNIELIQQGLEPNMALIQQGLEPNIVLIQQGLEPNIELIQQGLEPNIELIQQGLEPDHINTQSREGSVKPPQLQTCEPGVVVEQLIDELIQHSLDVNLLTTEQCEHYSESSEQQHQMKPILFYAKPTEQAHQMEHTLLELNSSEQTMSRKCSAEINIPKTEPNEHTLETSEHPPGIFNTEQNGHKLQPNEHDLEPNEHDLEQNEHDLETSEHAPDISNAEPNGHKLEQNEHDVEQNEHDVEQNVCNTEQNVCNTEQNEHDLVTYEHVLEQNEHDLVPYEHDLEPSEHDLAPYEHDLEPIEHDLEPNLCHAEPNTSNTGQLEVTGAIETGPRQNSSAAEQLNPSGFGGDKLEYILSCAQTGPKQNSSVTEQLNPSGFDGKLEGVLFGAQAAGNDQGKEEVKNVIAQLIELSLDIHLSMTEQGGRKFHPSVSEPSELCPDKVSDFPEQNEDLLEKNNYISHPTECVDLGLKSNENCPPRLKHKSINMRHVYPHRNVSNSSTTDCSLNTVNNQHKNEHNVTADALITKKQTESNLSAKEQSEHYPSATEQSEHNHKSAEQSADNPTSIDLSAAEDQPQTTDNKLL